VAWTVFASALRRVSADEGLRVDLATALPDTTDDLR